MNHEQLRIAMDAYNKRVQLDEAFTQGHVAGLQEVAAPSGPGRARLAPSIKKMMKYLSGKNMSALRSFAKRLERDPIFHNAVEDFLEREQKKLGRKLNNKEKNNILIYILQNQDKLGL
mgnify:CR=1 FL=1